MVGNLIQAKWWRGWLRGISGWQISDGSQSLRFEAANSVFEACPRDLRSPAMGKAFVNLLRECTDHTRSLHDWWLEYGASDSATALILDCATGPWEIPWELLSARFANASNRRRLRIVRTLGPGAAPIAKRQSARLRILVLQGSDGRARGAAIDLEREARNLSEAWKGLESQVRDKIDEPVVIPALERTFSGELRDKAPDVLWFSGHGHSTPKVELEFQSETKSSDWISAKSFAGHIKNSGHVPQYCVFLACETGRGDEAVPSTARLPTLYRCLHDVGVAAVLVMQSPIRDASCIAFARSFSAVGRRHTPRGGSAISSNGAL